MMLHHTTCHWSRWHRFLRWLRGEKGMPRFMYRANIVGGCNVDNLTHCQTLVCNGCGDQIHVDTDFQDVDGGFIGNQYTVNPFIKYTDRPDRSLRPDGSWDHSPCRYRWTILREAVEKILRHSADPDQISAAERLLARPNNVLCRCFGHEIEIEFGGGMDRFYCARQGCGLTFAPRWYMYSSPDQYPLGKALWETMCRLAGREELIEVVRNKEKETGEDGAGTGQG